MKISRNDPCPCESGLKYKKCCLNYENTFSDKKNENMISPVFKQHIANQLGDKFVVSDNEYQIKMSAVILEFADDILEQARTKKQRESAIAIACVAWNIALLGEDKRQSITENMCEKVSKNDLQAREDIDDILSFLIRKKLNEYPHINRYIVNYQYTEVRGDGRLNVASTISESEH